VLAGGIRRGVEELLALAGKETTATAR
jgi:hypothetical protein